MADVRAPSVPPRPLRTVVLGGSSPFIIELIEELAAVESLLPPLDLVLVGRDLDALRCVGRYTRSRLTGAISTSTTPEAALEGADLVVHLIRYGGMAGRSADERLATTHGTVPDETLGPGGLQRAALSAQGVRGTAATIARRCPDAMVLNLTNPLSVTTALMAENAGAQVIGLCELPTVTHERVERAVGVDPNSSTWGYSGLNHRGFVHSIRAGDRDLVDELIRCGIGEIDGVPISAIEELRAVPTKYFAMSSRRAEPGRADELNQLRTTILTELEMAPERRPPSLSSRSQPWFARAVVPVIVAYAGARPVRTTLNIGTKAGDVVIEQLVDVSHRSIHPLHAKAPNAAVARWVASFVAHEEAVLTAVRDPSLTTLAAALELDPITATHDSKAVAAQILEALLDQRSAAQARA